MTKLIRQLNNEHTLIDSSTAPLLARMRATLSAALGRPMEDGDPEMIAAASLLPFFAQGLASADIASKAMLLQFATDEDLDAIGTHYGMARRPVAATMIVRIVLDGVTNLAPGTYAVSITGNAPDGGPAFSYADPSYVVPAHVAYADFTVVCAVKGAAYNGLYELEDLTFSFVHSVDGQHEGLRAFVWQESRNGLDAETDDVYASRIHDTLLARNAAGSAAGYEALARTIDGVYDASAVISDYPDVNVFIYVVAPSRLKVDLQAEIEASSLLPLGLAVRVSVASEAPRGKIAICWSTPKGGDVDGINAHVNAALDAVLAPFYYTFTHIDQILNLGTITQIDQNLILGAVTDAGGVGAHIDGVEEVYGGSFLRLREGYLTEHTFTRTYEGVSQWI